MVLYLGLAAVEALLAIRPEEAGTDAATPVFNLHPDTIRRRLQRPPGRLGSPAGGTSPDTRGGLGWPRTCRRRGSTSPN